MGSPISSTRIDLLSVAVFTISLGLFSTAIQATVHHPDHFEYLKAKVISRLDDYNFVIESPEGVRLSITACRDFMPTSEIQAGVMLNWIGYDEDRVHHCDELDGTRKGYSLERDKHNVPIHHDWQVDAYSGPRSTRPCEAETAASVTLP